MFDAGVGLFIIISLWLVVDLILVVCGLSFGLIDFMVYYLLVLVVAFVLTMACWAFWLLCCLFAAWLVFGCLLFCLFSMWLYLLVCLNLNWFVLFY